MKRWYLFYSTKLQQLVEVFLQDDQRLQTGQKVYNDACFDDGFPFPECFGKPALSVLNFPCCLSICCLQLNCVTVPLFVPRPMMGTIPFSPRYHGVDDGNQRHAPRGDGILLMRGLLFDRGTGCRSPTSIRW